MRTVVEVVLDECKGKDVGRVHSVHLTIGELHDVVEEHIPGLFRYLTIDTIEVEGQVPAGSDTLVGAPRDDVAAIA